MAWYDNDYKYRKKITINATSAGAQTNYQKKVVVYKTIGTTTPFSFPVITTLEDKIDADPESGGNHAEGVTTDGTYLYATDRFHIYKLDKNGDPLDPVIENDHAMTDGTDCYAVTGLWAKDGKLYVGSGTWDAVSNGLPTTNYVKVFNCSDLSYVEEHYIGFLTARGTIEGACYHKGSWWVVFHDWKTHISRFDNDWNHVADYAASTQGDCGDGIFGIGDYLAIQTCELSGGHHDRCYFFKWNGSSLDACGYATVSGATCLQGGGVEPGEDIAWFADNTGANADGDIIKTSVKQEIHSLDGHCLDNFNDVRFTQSDGETELYHKKTNYTSGDNATFWVKFNSIPDSGIATFYVYYGKAGDSDGSDAANTFPEFFDDIENDNLNLWDTIDNWVSQDTVVKHGTYAAGESGSTGSTQWLKKTHNSTLLLAHVWARVAAITATTFIALADNNGNSTIWVQMCNGHFRYRDTGGYHYFPTDKTYVINTWYEIECGWDFANDKIHVWVDGAKLTGDGITLPYYNAPKPTSITELRIANGGSSGAAYIDDYFVRKFAYPEPTWGIWGDEEPLIESSVIVGLTVTALGFLGFARKAAVSVGLVASATIIEIAQIVASVAVGVVTSAARAIITTRNTATSVGLVASATKGFTSSVIVGAIASVTRLVETIRNAATLVGAVASTSRAVETTRNAATIIGIVATAFGTTANRVLAAVTIGVVTTTSRALEIVRQAATIVGLTGTLYYWDSPTGHNDPDSKWIWEDRAYDESLATGSWAYHLPADYDHYLELTLGSAIGCDRVRVYAGSVPNWPGPMEDAKISVDLFYDGNWHNIFSGTTTKQTWVTLTNSAGVKSVSKARIKGTDSDYYTDLYEFDFRRRSINASRLVEASRTATAQVGLVASATAQKLISVILASVKIGIVVAASKVAAISRVSTTIIGLVVSATGSWVAAGRYLRVKAATMQYRSVRAVTLAYRKIRAITLGE